MEKNSKIGKSRNDIFTPTSTRVPASVPVPASQTITKLEAKVDSKEAIVENEAPSPGRGRPQMHQEPTSKITTVLLNRQVVYLDDISNQIRRHSGKVVKRSEILRALVDALEESKPDLDQVSSQEDLSKILGQHLRR